MQIYLGDYHSQIFFSFYPFTIVNGKPLFWNLQGHGHSVDSGSPWKVKMSLATPYTVSLVAELPVRTVFLFFFFFI